MGIRWLVIIRDIVNIVVGAFGMIYSQVTGNTRIELIIVYAALLGVPGVLNLVELKNSPRSTGTTNGRSSESQDLSSRT